MPRPNPYRPQAKDMYWFAHGGIESSANQQQQPRSNTPGPGGDTEDESSENNSLTWKANHERRANSEEPPPLSSMNSKASDQSDGSGHSISARMNSVEKRLAVEERRRQLQEAEQEKNDAILRKHAEREAALEARRNAQRNNISFAFGSAVPPNGEMDIVPVQVSSNASVHHRNVGGSNNLMSQSMTGSISTSRGRRKNDLTPTVPYDRIAPPRHSAPVRKRSVSMSRLDILAQPRRPYVEAHKANSTMSSSSSNKEVQHSPNRPLSSASEKAGGSKAASSTTVVVRRPHGTVRKSRPLSIAGSVPDAKKPVRTSTPLRSNVRPQQQPISPDMSLIASASNARTPRAKSVNSTDRSRKPAPEKQKSPVKMTSTPTKLTHRSSGATKPSPAHKQSPTVPKQVTPKVSPVKKSPAPKKTATGPVTATVEKEVKVGKETPKRSSSPARSASPDDDSQSADEKNSSKRIISEEEAKAALAEKRRLAREQAEKEAELERQRLEELKLQEEERIRQEEEEQKRLEEEQLRLLDEHRKNEEEKLKKAIEEQERKEEEEKTRREEETRLKAELEKKAKEEAEKQRIELEEKLRKEEEERAERKKRLEKIMSRTRGKSSGTASPSGSGSGSDQPDSVESQHELLSSELSSLESNAAADNAPTNQNAEQQSPTESLDVVNQTLYLASQSLSSNDLMIPSSGNTSLDHASLDSNQEIGLVEEKIKQQDVSSGSDIAVIGDHRDDDATPVASEEDLLSTQVPEPAAMLPIPQTKTGDNFSDSEDQKQDVPAGDDSAVATQSVDVSEPGSRSVPDTSEDSNTAMEVVSHGDNFTVDSGDSASVEPQSQVTTSKVPFAELDEILLRDFGAKPEICLIGNYHSRPAAEELDGRSDEQEDDGNSVPRTGLAPDASEDSNAAMEVVSQADNFQSDSGNSASVEPQSQESTPKVPFAELDEILLRDFGAEPEICLFGKYYSEPSADGFDGRSDEPEDDGNAKSHYDLNQSQTFQRECEVPEPLATSSLEPQPSDAAPLQHVDDTHNQEASAEELDEEIRKHSDAELITCLPSPLPSNHTAEAQSTNLEHDFQLATEKKVLIDELGEQNDMKNPFGTVEQFDAQSCATAADHEENLAYPAEKSSTQSVSFSTDEANELVKPAENMFASYHEDMYDEDQYFQGEPPSKNPFGGNMVADEKVSTVDSDLSSTKQISIADELAFHQIEDSSDKNAFIDMPAHVLDHQNVQVSATSSSEIFLREFVGDNNSADQQQQLSRTQNPFGADGDVAFEANKPVNHSDVTEELIVNSLSYGDDSEGSSLDSNLSQILNVHSETVTNSDDSAVQNSAVQKKVVGNGSSSPDAIHSGLLSHQDELKSTSEQMFPSNNSLPKSNGYSLNANDRIFDHRFESDHKADTTSVVSDDFCQDRPVNGKIGTNATSTIVDNADSVNSNKVASNPFLGASDSNPFAANPFQMPEEKTFTA